MANRNFTINLIQTGTGKTQTVSVNQGNMVYTFKSNRTSFTPSQAGGAETVVITSTKYDGNTTSQLAWSIQSKPDWVTATNTSPTSFTITANTAARDRSGSIVLTQAESGNTLTINISTQTGVPVYVFQVNPSTYTFKAAGGSYDMVVTSTKTYNDKTTQETFSVAKASGSAKITNSNTRVTAQAATSYTDNETATFTLTQNGSNKKLTFTATLAKKADSVSLLKVTKVSPSGNIPYSGGTVRVKVEAVYASGKTEDVTASGNTLYLITYATTTSGGSSSGGSFSVSANTTYATKIVSISASFGGKSGSVTWTQDAKPDDGKFTANPTALNFPATGGTQTSTITSTSKGRTVGWTITNKSSLPSWIQVSGEGSGTLSITTTANN